MSESVSCKLCGSAETIAEPAKTRILRLKRDYQVCRCRDCGLLRLSPRPDRTELVVDYQACEFFASGKSFEVARHPVFFGAKVDRLERWTSGRGSLLAIGCSEGGYVMEAARLKGWQTLGLEFIEASLRFAREELKLQVIESEMWDLTPVRGQTYEVVYTHQLEHLQEPRQAIQEFRSLLKPGGILMMDVPNQFRSLKDQIRQAMYSVCGQRLLKHLFLEVDSHFHLSFFVPRTIRRLLEQEGFELLELRTYLPSHPFYHTNPRFLWLQELLYRVGGLFDAGPSIEIIARVKT